MNPDLTAENQPPTHTQTDALRWVFFVSFFPTDISKPKRLKVISALPTPSSVCRTLSPALLAANIWSPSVALKHLQEVKGIFSDQLAKL